MKTLALNMIVGAGESVELRRCLESVQGLFDEIVIVSTSDDKKIIETAKNFTDKIIFSLWICDRYPHGNFARARNAAIEKTKSDYIMWLDADDIVHTNGHEALFTIKEIISANDIDYFFVLYKLNKNDSVMRERIFRRDKNIRWFNPVHEELSLFSAKKYGTINGFHIEHHSTKPAIESIRRNLQIIEYEINLGTADPALLAYWAIENLNAGNKQDESIDALKMVFDKRAFPHNQLSCIASRIAIELLKQFKITGFYNSIIEIETYSRIAIDLCGEFAEAYITLAEVYILKKEYDKAIILLKEAMKKEVHVGGLQRGEYYRELPLKRLSDIYAMKKENELALYYNKKLLDIVCKPEYVEARNKLLVNVSEEIYVSTCQN